MKVLVIGNGAREHAMAWKLRQSPKVGEVLVAPGNAGTAGLARNVSIGATEVEALVRFAQEGRADLTVVGPEAPLAAGIVDRFQESGMEVFGPTKDAARIETSKSWAKRLMLELGVPTGKAEIFDSYADAVSYVETVPPPFVVKADGLAAGKGVVVAGTRDDALEALRTTMEERQFGAAGDTVLIEELLEGPEVSVFAFVDGQRVSPMVAACDYKRIGDGDVGANTGGMGSFSPTGLWSDDLDVSVRKQIMEPIVHALARRGTPYKGVLYAGLMLTGDGPKVVEFNCRLGDPEAQVILPRLKTDLLDAMMGSARGNIEDAGVQWDPTVCVGVVMASGGYPGQYATGYPVDGLGDVDEDAIVFHAGTTLASARERGDARVSTDGGRVLTVVGQGSTVGEARQMAYANVERIRFKDAFYRRDIAATG